MIVITNIDVDFSLVCENCGATHDQNYYEQRDDPRLSTGGSIECTCGTFIQYELVVSADIAKDRQEYPKEEEEDDDDQSPIPGPMQYPLQASE